MDGIEFLNFLGLDVESLIVSILALTIVLAIMFFVRVLRIESLYKRYEHQFSIIEKYAPDVFLRLAFPDISDEVLARELDRYDDIAFKREQSGLSWVDPRMLYAIDRIEQALPEGYKIDFNVVLDRAETIYRKMRDEGVFDNRTDQELVTPS